MLEFPVQPVHYGNRKKRASPVIQTDARGFQTGY